MNRRSFLQRLAKAVAIAASAPIIIREIIHAELPVISDSFFNSEINFAALQYRGPSLYDWVMADDKQAYLNRCRDTLR